MGLYSALPRPSGPTHWSKERYKNHIAYAGFRLRAVPSSGEPVLEKLSLHYRRIREDKWFLFRSFCSNRVAFWGTFFTLNQQAKPVVACIRIVPFWFQPKLRLRRPRPFVFLTVLRQVHGSFFCSFSWASSNENGIFSDYLLQCAFDETGIRTSCP